MSGGELMEGAKPIPADYAQQICSMVQTLGDMDQENAHFVGDVPRIGIFMADSGLYQRTFPDNVPQSGGVAAMNESLLNLKYRELAGEDVSADSDKLMESIGSDEGMYNAYVTSGAFPHFFGMAMPLLKGGIPLRPVQLENLDRYEDYLNEYDTLILSYEFMKPRKPEYHAVLADWVRKGGKLIYVGDGSDPYHKAQDWWNQGDRTWNDPGQHLLSLLEVPDAQGVYPVGEGCVALYRISPARITLTDEAADLWQHFVKEVAAPEYGWKNYLDMVRGPYRITCVMDEGMTGDSLELTGNFVDLLDNTYPVIRKKVLHTGENSLLFDLDAVKEDPVRIIGTSARIFSMEETESGYTITCKAASRINVAMRLKVSKPVFKAKIVNEQGMQLEVDTIYDEKSSTVYLCFPSDNTLTTLYLA